MIKFENLEVIGWDHAIRGMRNPKNSWDKMDSEWNSYSGSTEEGNLITSIDLRDYVVGPNDQELMIRLAKGGPVHAKFRRMITVYVDIIAPLYWWKEFDTYKVGTVANSCSTMHKIQAKEFELDDFSHEHMVVDTEDILKHTIRSLNAYRLQFLDTKDKLWWWQMIQLLPSSYNQKRTIMMNYEVLVGMYKFRQNHKLDEWCELCKWIEKLPFSEIITGEKA